RRVEVLAGRAPARDRPVLPESAGEGLSGGDLHERSGRLRRPFLDIPPADHLAARSKPAHEEEANADLDEWTLRGLSPQRVAPALCSARAQDAAPLHVARRDLTEGSLGAPCLAVPAWAPAHSRAVRGEPTSVSIAGAHAYERAFRRRDGPDDG